jgi:hypothetical protein
LSLLELVLRLVPLLDLNLELVAERFDAGFGRFDLFLRGSGGDVGGADDGEGEDRGDREPPDPYRPDLLRLLALPSGAGLGPALRRCFVLRSRLSLRQNESSGGR